MNISILDCTLRDGGCVNGFDFEGDLMRSVAIAVSNGRAEYIELGYLDSRKGNSEDSSCFCDMNAYSGAFEPRPSDDKCMRFLMIDQGKFSPEDLPVRSSDTADGIRICFRKDKIGKALEDARQIASKGYEIFIQPMICTRYTDEEFIDLIRKTEEAVPSYSAFYIVDSFGELDEKEVADRVLLADRYMSEGKKIGVHTHNNRGLCFEHARKVTGLTLSHDVIIDCTLRGMGKGAGNLPTEVLAEFLSDEFGMDYRNDIFTKTSDLYIASYQDHYTWGDSEEYRLSAKYSVTPSYIKMIMEKYEPDISSLEEIISGIPPEKRDAFDPVFARKYCDGFFALRRAD